MRSIYTNGLIHLPERVAIYVPAEFKNEILRVQQFFNKEFGGSTVINGMGSWIGEKGLEIEEVAIIYSNLRSLDDITIRKVLGMARHVKSRCKQEAVSVEFSGEMYLI